MYPVKRISKFNIKFQDEENIEIIEQRSNIENIKECFTPETMPVGIMASMIKEQVKKNKENNKPFVPYQKLEIQNIPFINMNELPNKRTLAKLDNFYKFYLELN